MSHAIAEISATPQVGIGLRTPHWRELVERRPALGFVEVHAENYFGGGVPLAQLARVRELYPVSVHGIGASLGSADPLSREHLAQLKDLVERVQPALVSEHLAWCSIDGRYFNDLLPMPLTSASVRHVAQRIERVQDYLRREILVENLSSYDAFPDAEMSEAEYVSAVANRAGCRLLLDVNNVYVSATNLGFDPYGYLDAIPARLVGEIHLAGHTRHVADGRTTLIDTHSAPVCAEVWSLYAHAVRRFGHVPTLVEWDADLPALQTLLDEAERAAIILGGDRERAA